jgi:4-amino-4-deoxy-L-arabinose transferase-like glycosyltransferase
MTASEPSMFKSKVPRSNLPGSQTSRVPPRREKTWWLVLLAATTVNCVFQFGWFWRFRSHNITMDGINYIGLARHLSDGNFKASLHGYWSPLVSWMIAAASVFGQNFTLAGRLVTIASFLVCLPLVYLLTLRLWHSRTAAALAVFWFCAARGMVELSVEAILADFVLTACVLLYFIFLLDALRRNKSSSWIFVGTAHGLAFLAKAIAMPWLSIASALAVLIRNRQSSRRLAASFLLAFLFPAIVWASWGNTLRMKYGVFTTGYQLRANLMTNWRRWQNHRLLGDSLAFAETSSVYDKYMVAEGSFASIQSFNLRNPELLRMIVASERRNLPQAVKETTILLTPAGALIFPLMLALLIRNRSRYESETAFAGIALISVLSLIFAYCMLVFDGRYVIPIVPVLMAISCPVLLPAGLAPGTPSVSPWVQRTGLGLLAASILFFTVYWASPYRTIDRDYEASCYQAAAILRHANSAGTFVSLGDGPYPEHGVGFEVAPYIAYLSGWRVVGGNAELPPRSGAPALAAQALAVKANAVAVWGSPADPRYSELLEDIRQGPEMLSSYSFADPYKGEVGTIFLFGPKSEP